MIKFSDKRHDPFHEDSLVQIANAVPELRLCSLSGIQELWEEYSDTMCAGFLIPDGHIDGFRIWLNHKIDSFDRDTMSTGV